MRFQGAGPACGGYVCHLLGEDSVASGAGLEGGEVAGAGDEWLVFVEDLVAENADAAAEIVGRVEDGAAGVLLRETTVVLPVEVAAVEIGVLVGELEKALLLDGLVGDLVELVDGGLGVVDDDGLVEAGFGAGEGLEEVGPEGALIGLGFAGEVGAEAVDGAGGGGGEHVGRQGALDEGVPGRIPGPGAAKVLFLFGEGRGRSGFHGRRGGGGMCGLGLGAAAAGTAEREGEAEGEAGGVDHGSRERVGVCPGHRTGRRRQSRENKGHVASNPGSCPEEERERARKRVYAVR